MTNPPRPPQAVIFDIGNVLITWKPERFYDATFGQARRRAMFAAVDLHGMNDRVDRGGDFRDVVYETARAFPEFEAEIRLWHDRWSDLTGPVIEGSVALMRALRARGVPVFAFTNFGRGSFAVSEADHPFLREFDRRYISGHMYAAKPDDEIYAMVEADCGIDPSSLIFADDRAENIAAAAARGWRTHLFDGPGGWARRLVAEGLLTEEEAGL